MKKTILIITLLICGFNNAQEQDQRILKIKNQLEFLATEVNGLTENVKTEINVANITLSNFLLAISEVHKVNINISPQLNQISIANNFTDVSVADLLIFLCKEYNLTIDFTGNILSIKQFVSAPDIPKKRIIPIAYNPSNQTISIDAKGDSLYDVFKRIMEESGKNLVFSPGLENKLLTAYIQQTSFDTAMDKLAFANNLYVEQSKDGFYVFEDNSPSTTSSSSGSQRPSRSRNSNFFFNLLNLEDQLLEVDFVNTPIADIINDIGTALNIDVFTATPLDQAGLASFKAKSISFDVLLSTIFEGQSNQNLNASNPNSANNSNFNNQNQQSSSNGNNRKSSNGFTYKKEGSIYFFGTANQLSVREVAIIQLQHRSVELLSDPSGGGGSRNSRSQVQNVNPNSRNNTNINSNQIDNFSNQNRNQLNTNSNQSFNNYSSKAEALVNILPDEIIEALDIKVDYELNSFYVNGPSSNVKRFREFISKIDKPVPVILIEVMLIEVTSNATVETGVSWGIGDEPTETTGSVFPNADLTVGARTINKVIGGFDGFGSLNLGKVVPNFFATIKALESNGKLKVRSTPKLSTLNGHRAHFSNGQTSYYTVTQRNIYGTDNPQTSEITNYQPIEAELGLTIKPIVSGNGQVTLDIFVVQSNFRGRISEDAPPDISSREFSSIIRVKDQDIVVLGGLEEQFTDNSGTGVPFLSRIPIIKWLFSSRKREAKKARLTVLIKPTIIY
tara:strand:- start:2206 stop:4401 length:2196 start_codon:yes stop_codon:yes gene_type:complete